MFPYIYLDKEETDPNSSRELFYNIFYHNTKHTEWAFLEKKPITSSYYKEIIIKDKSVNYLLNNNYISSLHRFFKMHSLYGNTLNKAVGIILSISNNSDLIVNFTLNELEEFYSSLDLHKYQIEIINLFINNGASLLSFYDTVERLDGLQVEMKTKKIEYTNFYNFIADLLCLPQSLYRTSEYLIKKYSSLFLEETYKIKTSTGFFEYKFIDRLLLEAFYSGRLDLIKLILSNGGNIEIFTTRVPSYSLLNVGLLADWQSSILDIIDFFAAKGVSNDWFIYTVYKAIYHVNIDNKYKIHYLPILKKLMSLNGFEKFLSEMPYKCSTTSYPDFYMGAHLPVEEIFSDVYFEFLQNKIKLSK